MRISDWSSDVCSSDLLLRKQEGAALIRHGFGAVRQNAVDRERLGDRFLPDIADPFGKLVRHAQLFRREGDLDAAVGDDLIRHVLTIDSAKLRAGLEDRKSVVEGKSVSVRVDLGGSRIINKKKTNERKNIHTNI